MKSTLLIVSCLTCFIFNAFTSPVTYRWAKQYGGSGIDQGRDVVTDAEGYIYFTGNFGGTANFAGLTSNITLTNVGSSGEDIYVAKADADGNVIWAKQMGGPEHDRGIRLALDGQGKLYVCGYFTATATFSPTITLQSGGYADGFLMQMDTNGTVNWVRQLKGKVGNDQMLDLAVDGQQNVWVTGTFLDSADVGIPGAPHVLRTGRSVYNTFLGKYDHQGNLIHALMFQPQQYGSVSGTSITIDRADHIYVTGAFNGTIDFDPGPAGFPMNNGTSFIAKYDSAGKFVWAKELDLSNGMEGDINVIHADPTNDALYIGGFFEDRADFDPGPARQWLDATGFTSDGFILKLDTAGSFQWVRQLKAYYGLKVADLETDKLGRLYSTGYFMSTCDLDPGPDTLALTSNGGFDTYLLSLDTSGNLLWGKSFGGNNNETPTGMSVSENFVINTTGLFSGNADFHIESDSFHYVNSAGNHDIFIHQVSVFACKEFDVTILVNKDTLTIAEDFISYQWMLNGDTIQGATGKSYIATLNGHYQVAFVDENGCEGISRLYEVNNLGIPVTNEKNIFIYPNPGSERLYISSEQPIHCTITTLNGTLVKTGTEREIIISELPAGIYIVRVWDSTQLELQFISKLTIVR